MNFISRASVLLLGTLALGACSSNAFKLVSTPVQAEVFIENPKTGEKKNIGKTPLEMPMDQLSEQIGADALEGDYVTLIIEKPGFINQKLAIPAGHFGTIITSVDVKLKEGDQAKEVGVATSVLNHFFLAQKLALNQEFERAQSEVDKILELAPNMPRALSMRASIYYVQKNFPEALKWYEAALKEDPQMDEAVKMIAKINGGKPDARVPAAAAAGAPVAAPAAPAAGAKP